MQHAEIRIKGQIDANWSDWFDNLTITHVEQAETILSGDIPDQSALHGLLTKLRDLGLPIVSVNLSEAADEM